MHFTTELMHLSFLRGVGRAKARTRKFPSLRQSVITAVLVATIAVGGTSANAQQKEFDTQTAVATLQKWITLHEELRQHIDRSQFELEDALDAAGYEAELLTKMVQEKVQFQQYAGVMRGAQGTLATRSGNALDQALLLATLLKDSGYEAQIIRATLDEAAARTLVSQMQFFTEPEPPFKLSASKVMIELGELAGQYVEPTARISDSDELGLADRESEADLISSRLIASLEENGLPLAQGDVPTELVQEARDYFWVRYRLGSSDPWADAHPAFATRPQALEDLQPHETFAEEIPADLHQRFEVQGFVKRRLGRSEETQEIFQAWNRPVANLFESPFVYSHFAPSLGTTPEGTESDRTTLILPMFGDSPAPAAKAFSLNGNVVPLDAAMSNYAGVFATVSDKTISAASALSGLDSKSKEPPQPAMALEDVWLQFTLQVPGKDDRTWQRSFRSQQGSQPITMESLARRVVVNLHLGTLAPAKQFDRTLEFYVQALKLTLAQHQAIIEDSLTSLGRSDKVADRGGHSSLDSNVLFASLSDYLDVPGELSYRHEPMIVAEHISYMSGASEPSGLDIIHNARRSFVRSTTDTSIRFSPETTLRKGVWEAMTEATIMGELSDATVNAVQASSTIVKGLKPLVVTQQNLDGASKSIPEDLSSEVTASVEQGNIAIIPASSSEAQQRAWWRVNPETGQTLGLTDNQWGGSYFIAAVELGENVIIRKIVIAVTCSMLATQGCREYAKFATSTIYLAVTKGGKAGCVAIINAIFGDAGLDGLPPICNYVDMAGPLVGKMVSKMEKPLYQRCNKIVLPKCIEAATAGP